MRLQIRTVRCGPAKTGTDGTAPHRTELNRTGREKTPCIAKSPVFLSLLAVLLISGYSIVW